MTFYRVHRRIAAWLAMLAMAMGALAPTLAHAWVAAADEGQWIEVCSVSGMVWLKADGLDGSASGTSDQNMPADMGKHCPWSSVHATTAGLPSATTAVVFASADKVVLPVASDVDLPGQVQRGIQARAPPITS